MYLEQRFLLIVVVEIWEIRNKNNTNTHVSELSTDFESTPLAGRWCWQRDIARQQQREPKLGSPNRPSDNDRTESCMARGENVSCIKRLCCTTTTTVSLAPKKSENSPKETSWTEFDQQEIHKRHKRYWQMCFAIKCRNISVVQVRSCNRDLLLLVLCVDE